MFERLTDTYSCFVSTIYKNDILQHFTALENEIIRYSLKLSDGRLGLVRNSFKFSVKTVHDDCHNEFMEPKAD